MAKSNKKSIGKELDILLQKGLEKGVFSGACVSYFKTAKFSGEKCFFSCGTTSSGETGSKVNEKTFFDLASLTKPLVTTLSAAVLIEKGVLYLEDKLSDCCRWEVDGVKRDIKVVHLLSHSSGLPAHRPYYEKLYRSLKGDKKEKLKKWILNESLSFAPGTGTLYSDLGFILLGFLIEEKSGENLDAFWEKKITAPLKLQKEIFFPRKGSFDRRQCISTEKCIWTGQMLSGEVHDDNCRAMGGVAGHAGLFGTAAAVLSLCEHLLKQFKGKEEHPSYSSELLRSLLKRVYKEGWSCGFDTVTKGKSSSGNFFSEGSRGHLGFTGTSFWIDFEREAAVVLLTNRVHMGSSLEGIQKLRPQIHDAIMKG